jgi:predicted RNase H-like HicB family nuclease
MTRQVLLYPGEDGFVVAEVPSLPGCVSQGRTSEEALDNVREAISLHEEVLRERGEPLPEDRVELVERCVNKLPVISGADCVKASARLASKSIGNEEATSFWYARRQRVKPRFLTIENSIVALFARSFAKQASPSEEFIALL